MEERPSGGAEAQSSQGAARRRRRAPRIQNTLAIFVQSLQGSTIAVELKNDVEITGVLEETDVSMNMTMRSVQQTFPNGKRQQLDILFVNGKMIRYVHIPDRINIYRNLNAHMARVDRIASGNRRHIIKDKPK